MGCLLCSRYSGPWGLQFCHQSPVVALGWAPLQHHSLLGVALASPRAQEGNWAPWRHTECPGSGRERHSPASLPRSLGACPSTLSDSWGEGLLNAALSAPLLPAPWQPAAQLLLFLPPSSDPGWKVQLHNCHAAPRGRRNCHHCLHRYLQHPAGPLCRR